MKSRRTIPIILLLIVLLPTIGLAKGEGRESLDITNKFIQNQLDSLNIRELETILKEISTGADEIFPKTNVRDYISSLIKGEDKLDINKIRKYATQVFFNEAINNLGLISQVLFIAIACSILTSMQTAFERDSIAQLAHYACYLILAMLMMNSFVLAMDLGKKAVYQMVEFMQIILPILLTILIAIGGPNINLIFHPMVVGLVNIISSIIKDLVFPLIFFTFIIGLISNISQKVQFTKLSELMRQIIIVILGVSFTIFIGLVTVYGIGANIDGVTIRTAKFAVDSFIPIIGKFLSDAVETVVGCTAILKNGIGMVGLISLFIIIIVPAIKIAVLVLVYKLLAAFIEPIASANIVSSFNEISKSLILLFVSVLSVAIMFYITISVIVEAGNTTLMLR